MSFSTSNIPQQRRTPLAAAMAAALCLGAAQTALVAHAADAPTPGAGNLLQQVAPATPPALPGRASRVVVEQAPGQALPPSTAFDVQALQISGNTVFESAALLALVADARGQRLTLAQLDQLITRITEHYRRAGYPLARAIIPAQTIQAGVVRIEVVEARLGAVQLDNRSAVDKVLVERMLAPLQPGEVITQAALDRPLLLIGDLPGLRASAVVRAGTAVGTSDLALRLDPGPAWVAQAAVDNHGNRYTGQSRVAAGGSLFNPLQRGDVLNASLLSAGRGLQSGRVGYEAPLGAAGTRAGASFSALRYELGDSAADLLAHGTASSSVLSLAHPLRRGSDWNLRAEVQAEHLALRDHVDATGIRNDRHLDLLTLRVSGDVADDDRAGAQLGWNLALAGGRLRFDDAAAAASDTASSQTAGGFSKLEGQVLAVRPVAAGMDLALSLRGQRAQGNLDASQKLSLGGPASVRAYDAGALSGDSGWVLSAEWRQTLPLGAPGAWQAIAFVDSGHVTINQRPWRSGTNSASLSGVGVGLNWAGPADWVARLSLATPMGTRPVVDGLKRSAHAWLDLRKVF